MYSQVISAIIWNLTAWRPCESLRVFAIEHTLQVCMQIAGYSAAVTADITTEFHSVCGLSAKEV